MPQDYLNGRIYHMTHTDNLLSIFQQQALLSQARLDQIQIYPFSIANEEVQRLRKRIYVWDSIEKQYRALHSYIPFYFAEQTPMLRNQYNNGNASKIVIFEASRSLLTNPQVLFTDGNASMQHLSKSGEEIVRIVPVIAANTVCRREYIPDGIALGTNQNSSDFYNDHNFLEKINWDVIYRRSYLEMEEYKRVVHAEALFPDQFPLDKILCISTLTQETLQATHKLMEAKQIKIRLKLNRWR